MSNKFNNIFKALLTGLVLSGAVLLSSFVADAENISWSNVSGGNWRDADNWSTATVPGASDDVAIILNGTYNITLDADATVANLVLGGSSGSQTLTASGRTLTLNGASVINSNGILTLNSSTISGSGTLTNDGTLNLNSSTTNGNLDNRATLSINGHSRINGAFSMDSAALLRFGAGSHLTLANSFTNRGTIEFQGRNISTLEILEGGEFINSEGSTFDVSHGRLLGQLNNQGTFNVENSFILETESSSHTNGGTINVNGNLTITQSEGASFTNTGDMNIFFNEQQFVGVIKIRGGMFNHNGGTLGGTGSLQVENATFGMNGGVLSLDGSKLPGGWFSILLNSATFTLSTDLANTFPIHLNSSTFNGNLDNRATLSINGHSRINGAFSMDSAALLRFGAGSHLTLANSFTNRGTIEFQGRNISTLEILEGGEFINSEGSTFDVSHGRLLGQLNNQGTFNVENSFILETESSSHTNGGTINVNGNLTITQSEGASFTNTGDMNIFFNEQQSVGVIKIRGGMFNHNGGTLGGTGSLQVENATFGMNGGVLSLDGSKLPGGWFSILLNSATFTLSTDLANTFPIHLNSSTFNGNLDNRATLSINGHSRINGAFSMDSAALLRFGAGSQLTLPNSFTNRGTIEFNGRNISTLEILEGGEFINSEGSTFDVFNGRLLGQLNNQGIFNVENSFILETESSSHTNGGTISVNGNLTITQSGEGASFTNTGDMNIVGVIKIRGGMFNHNGGTIGGMGSLQVENAMFGMNGGVLSLGGSKLPSDLFSLLLKNTNFTLSTDLAVTFPLHLTHSSITGSGSLANKGVIQTVGHCTIDLPLTTHPGSILRVKADGSQTGVGNSTLTMANGFTNRGTLEFTTIWISVTPSLGILNGELINAPEGVILFNPITDASITGGKGNLLSAKLNNQGTINVEGLATIDKESAAHTNTGIINISSPLTIRLSGTDASFTSTGDINTHHGGSITVRGGKLNLGGTIKGDGGLFLSDTVSLVENLSNQSTISLTNVTLNGPGVLDNKGDILVRGTCRINGPLTTQPGSRLQLRSEGNSGGIGRTTLTMANGFTNRGTMDLVTTWKNVKTTLNIEDGPLINAPEGTLLVGHTDDVLTDPFTRISSDVHLLAQLNNQGTLNIENTLTVDKRSAAHINSGTINVREGGNPTPFNPGRPKVTVVQTGVNPSFTNTGTININKGLSVTISGGTFYRDKGTVQGGGVLDARGATVVEDGPGTGNGTPSDSISVRVSDVVADPGSEVSVTIDVDNATGITAGNLTLIYDSSALTAKGASRSRLLLDTGIASVVDLSIPGQINLSLIGDAGVQSGRDALMTITFNVRSDAPSGVYRLELAKAIFRDEEDQLIPVQGISPGFIIIPEKFPPDTGQPPPGSNAADFDGDGRVGFSDFFLFAEHFETTGGDPDYDQRIDLDGDGNVGFQDLVKFTENYGKRVGQDDHPPISGNESISFVRGGTVAATTEDPDLPLVALHENGDWMGVITDGKDILQGAVYTSKDGRPFTLWVGADGLPLRLDFGDRSLLFAKFGGDSVSVVEIMSDGELQIYQAEVNLDLLDPTGNKPALKQRKPVAFYQSDESDLEKAKRNFEFWKKVNSGVSWISCKVGFILGEDPFDVAWACGSALVSDVADATEDDGATVKKIARGVEIINIFGNSFDCGVRLSFISCVSLGVSAKKKSAENDLAWLILGEKIRKKRREIGGDLSELDEILDRFSELLTARSEARGSEEFLPNSVSISPQKFTLLPGGELHFRARVRGIDDTRVTWSILEGTAGGTITVEGLYTASDFPTTYHIVATTVADPSLQDTATVTVAKLVSITSVEPRTLGIGQSQEVTIQGLNLELTAGARIDRSSAEVSNLTLLDDGVKMVVRIGASESAGLATMTLETSLGDLSIDFELKERRLRGAVLELEGSAPGWELPVTVSLSNIIPVTGIFIGSNNKSETGGPLFSQQVEAGAVFYTVITVDGFPGGGPLGGEVNKSGGSSFIAVKGLGTESEKVWINASVRIFRTQPFPLPPIEWEYQIRYSGNPQKPGSSTVHIGAVPGSGNFSNVVEITPHSVELIYE